MCQRAFELTAGHTPCRHPREGGDLVERLGDSRTCGNDGVAGRVASNARGYQARRGGIMAGHAGWAVPTHHSTRADETMVGSANPPCLLATVRDNRLVIRRDWAQGEDRVKGASRLRAIWPKS